MTRTARLPTSDIEIADDPLTIFDTWMAEAVASEPNDPNGMAVATVDANGLPDVRMVLLKGHDARGFVFYTNFESAKGQELLGQPKAALLFHWKSLRRQIRIRGPVSEVSKDEADAYFASRPHDSQIASAASRQSRPLAHRSEFEAEIARLAALYPGQPVPRPPQWSGFRVAPLEIEFWLDGAFRMHHRLVYRRTSPSEAWRTERLYP